MAIEKDLIDVNEFRKLFWTKLKDLKYIGPFDVDYIILNTPKVDAVEVVYGHWILRKENSIYDMTYQYECSQCALPSRYATNYCPHCGAKMTEVSNE